MTQTATQEPKKKMGLGKKILIGVGVVIALGVLANLGEDDGSADSTSSATEQSAEPLQEVAVGDVLQTDYFAIQVNGVSIEDRISTGNEFSDLAPEDGIKFLVIDASFKNTDSESRMLMEGSVWINYNGQDYEFDKSEMVMAEGWGLMLDQINPLTTKTTKLVYKLPAEISGAAYWQPGRADSDQRILLGNIE